MAGIPEDKVQEVRERVDIVDLIGRYVELRPAGRNHKGLCPFHDERTPSFNVNPERKGYKCFGCGAGGDAIRFVMELEGKSFPEAVRKLAELYGVNLPAASAAARNREDQRRTERDEASTLLRTAMEVYRQVLLERNEGEAGRRYVAERGISPDTAEVFQLGYAPDPSEAGWELLTRELTRRKLSLELAEKLGLVGRSDRRAGAHRDRFLGRLMFPVIQPGGEVVAFSGRIVPPHDQGGDNPPPKYVNSSESVVFRKGDTLFGLHAARSAIRNASRVLLVEGNIDVVALYQRGFAETVAPLGTALTEKQARILARFTEQVILCFDGDAAGKKAAAAAMPTLLAEDLDVRIVLLPEGEDPDSVDPERFATLVRDAQPALQVMMETLASRAGTAIDARARALDRVLPLIAGLPRASARALYAERASELFKVPLDRLRQLLKQKSRPAPSNSPDVVPTSADVRSPSPLPDGQAQLAALLVDVPHLASLAERRGVSDYVTDPRLAAIVHNVIEGAKTGVEPTMPELLDLVDQPSQRAVFEAVFNARAPDGQDPTEILDDLLARCEEDQLQAQIEELDREVRGVQASGDVERLRELVQRRVELVASYQDLRRRRALGLAADPPPNEETLPE
jgi:DNA primase